MTDHADLGLSRHQRPGPELPRPARAHSERISNGAGKEMGKTNIAIEIHEREVQRTKKIIATHLEQLVRELGALDISEKVEALNNIKKRLHSISPFKGQPVDCVLWVHQDAVRANDYNPNSVAPPEMRLLKRSVDADGYTQPIVSWPVDEIFEVVDGFHRYRVGRECKSVENKVHGYLPVTVINPEREDRGDRIAATIRHNRARGKHKVESMSEIVLELKRRNWSPKKIGTELGMDPDEVLRLVQITGLAEMFADEEFSEAWEADILDETDFISHDD